MEFKQLQYFLAAAEYLNFTEAAQACFIVQSAMSQQISSLEKELGVTLFVREKRALHLTAEGEVLVLEARKILNQMNRSRQLVQNVAKGYQHLLRVGCNGNLCRETLPQVLERFRKDYPDVKVLTMHRQHADLMTQLENGQIDCMISLFWPEYNLKNWMSYYVLKEEPVFAMLPSSHPLAKCAAVSKEELEGERLILLSGSDKTERLAAWTIDGVAKPIYAYVNSQESVETLVAAGYGISMSVESACRPHPMIAYVPMKRPHLERICLLWNKHQAVQEWIDRFASLFMMEPSEM